MIQSNTRFHEEHLEDITRQLAQQGITHPRSVLFNLSTAQLYEEIVRRGEGDLASGGPVVVRTGVYTGRSAQDKFVVDEPGSRDRVYWGDVNRPFSEERYQELRNRVTAFLQDRDLFVQECRVGSDPAYQRRVRVVTLWAWHALFARNLFIHPRDFTAPVMTPDFTVIAAPIFKAIPEQDHTRSEAFIIVHPGRREILIGGTGYSGEIKKSIFTVMNDLLPLQGVFPMHCSANISSEGSVAIFFGLSGTGKTTLSTDPERSMIGDDEHGWSEQGIFNFEGGCYAKVIQLSQKAEPQIYACTRKFGTVMENVVLDPISRRVDLDDAHFTENTRAAYPLNSLPNLHTTSSVGHPDHVIMLTADAFGVLPPVAKLTEAQAMYHFLLGYTSKLAGTERGITEPKITFSSCFGEPFMVHDPVVYANMLGKRLRETGARCWLVNTGWTGGPYGVGKRMPIQETRAIIHRILSKDLDAVATRRDAVFNLDVPVSIPGVSEQLLTPRSTWRDTDAYDAKARFLAEEFSRNFKRFEGRVSEEVHAAGPVRP